MSRPLRIEYNNAVYHITARGNEKKDIFLDERDFEKFLYYLDVVYERYNIIVYSFVLMNNHYHILLVFSRAQEELAQNTDLRKDVKRIEKMLFDTV